MKRKKAKAPKSRNWLAVHARMDLATGGERKGAGPHGGRKQRYSRKVKHKGRTNESR